MPRASTRRTAPPDRSPAAAPQRLGAAERKLLLRAASSDPGAAPRMSPGLEALIARGLVEIAEGRLVVTAEGRARAARETGGDAGFLAQHRALENRTFVTERGQETLLVDLDESPLAWLARRKGRDGKPLLAPAEVAAGERLRADFTRGQMGPRVTANWEAPVARGRRGGGSGAAETTDVALAARSRVARAVEAVGPELSGALIDVCCFLKGLEDVERDRGWPARGAKLVLGLALARLARHYGLTMTAPASAGRIVRWGTPDSRPKIDGGIGGDAGS